MVGTIQNALFFHQPIEQPVHTNQIPREIPEQNWLSHSIPSSLMGGILPFGCVFIQLFFILNSIWCVAGQPLPLLYNLFSTVCVGVVRCITCLASSYWPSLFCWWCVHRHPSFSAISICVQRTTAGGGAPSSPLVCLLSPLPLWLSPPPPPPPPGTTALYLFLFSVHYFVYKTTIIGGLSYLLYFGYTFIMVFLFWILTGEPYPHLGQSWMHLPLQAPLALWLA